MTPPSVLRTARRFRAATQGVRAASGLVGVLSRRGWDRSVRSSIGAMLLGSIAIYLVGVPWLYHALPPTIGGTPVTLDTALSFGLYPFIIGDTVKLLVAAGLLPVAWRVLDRFRPRNEDPGCSTRRGPRGGRALEPWYHVDKHVALTPAKLWFTWRFEDLQHIPPAGPAIVACNHISYLDPIGNGYAVMKAGRRPRFLAKDELFDIPVVGRALRGAQDPWWTGASGSLAFA